MILVRGTHTYIPRARLVMQAVLKRTLGDSEHVHHINGIKDDDRPANLTVLTRAAHTALHHAQGDIHQH